MTVVRVLELQTGGGLSGGIAGYISALTRSSTMEQFQFIVTVGPGETSDIVRSDKYGGSKIIELPTTYTLASFFQYVTNLKRVIDRFKVDLVHCHALRAGFACAFLSLFRAFPFVYTNHGLRYVQRRGALARFFRVVEWFVLSRASAAVCIRPSDAILARTLSVRHRSKVVCIVTRLDLDRGPIRGEVNDPLVVCGIGRLVRFKRADRFIDWVKELRSQGIEVVATWYGDGELRSELAEYADKHEVQIEWAGDTPNSDVMAGLDKASLLFLTSDHEALSLAALEAMSRGVPIMAMNFFGVEDFVWDGRNGLVFDFGASTEEVIERVVVTVRDKRKILEMAREAQDIFEKEFKGCGIMADEYSRLFRRVLRLEA